MLKGIAHAAFHVNDMAAATKFYETLGLTKAFTLNGNDGKPWIEYFKVADGQFLELFYAPESFEPVGMWKNRYFAHLCLEVDDIDDIADKIVKGGYELAVKPTQGADKNWQCWTHDPDGNAVEIMKIDPASPQANA